MSSTVLAEISASLATVVAYRARHQTLISLLQNNIRLFDDRQMQLHHLRLLLQFAWLDFMNSGHLLYWCRRVEGEAERRRMAAARVSLASARARKGCWGRRPLVGLRRRVQWHMSKRREIRECLQNLGGNDAKIGQWLVKLNEMISAAVAVAVPDEVDVNVPVVKLDVANPEGGREDSVLDDRSLVIDTIAMDKSGVDSTIDEIPIALRPSGIRLFDQLPVPVSTRINKHKRCLTEPAIFRDKVFGLQIPESEQRPSSYAGDV